MADAKFSSQLRSLKETFPDWSNDDLHSLLLDVNGDVNLAAGRISDGVAVQWDSVSRKKDKKATPAQPSSKEFTPSRGESRGARGGRGGRGGTGRGGATARGRGAYRGAAVNGHAARTASPRPAADHSTSTSAPSAHPDSTDPSKTDVDAQQNGVVQTPNAWAESKPDESSNANKKVEAETNAAAAAASANVALPKQALKTPASARGPTKLSWAQIASKPTHKPTPPPPHPSQQSPTTVPPPQESDPEPQASGWEDPTTAPSWEPEPSQPPAMEVPAEEPQPEPPALETVVEKSEDPPKPPALVQAPIPEPAPAKVDPSSQSVPPSLSTSALTSSAAATPSPKLSSRSAVASSRASARNRATDQPVVMPSSFGTGVEKVGMQFGSLSLNGESLFETTPIEPEAPASAAPAAPETAATTTTPNKPQYEASTSTAPPATAPAASTSLGSVFQHQQQQAQQNIPPQPQHQSSVGASTISHQTLTTSVSQPTQSTQQAAHASATATSPLQQFSHQQQATSQPPSLVNLQQTQQQQQQQNHHQLPQHQHIPQQVQQSHTHHQYSQHLPAQLDSQQHLPSTTQQPPSATTHSSYFRQTDTTNAMPYFHTPTPPAGQSQDSPYGAFSQLASQTQHQQGSHLAGFNSPDYNYDNQRGFYESYPQQTGFGNRNVLGHDDNIKGLPGSQQQPPTNSMPPSANQVSQHSSQSAAQPQSAGGQGPQFPPPVPYYYNPYPQNQYYGTPYSSGYVPQPYVKYPTMFPPGPPGSNSAPSPATKQPGGNVNVAVQPQSNPYSQSLYGQQGAYDDYQQHAHHSQHQHPHALGLGQTNAGVGATDYSKQLYGGAGQGFIGLGGQSGGAASGVAGAGPRNASSPETAYKYQKDGGIGVGGGRGGSVQGGPGQGQPQSQSAGQGGQGGPQNQGYYGANRFSGGVGAGISSGVGPQQNAHHQQGGPQGHLAYPQGANDGNFYPYQRQQYWQ